MWKTAQYVLISTQKWLSVKQLGLKFIWSITDLLHLLLMVGNWFGFETTDCRIVKSLFKHNLAPENQSPSCIFCDIFQHVFSATVTSFSIWCQLYQIEMPKLYRLCHFSCIPVERSFLKFIKISFTVFPATISAFFFLPQSRRHLYHTLDSSFPPHSINIFVSCN